MAEQRDFNNEFQSIAQKCQIPREWLDMSADGFVRVLAPETATYGEMMCVLGELKTRKIPMKVGYISTVR